MSKPPLFRTPHTFSTAAEAVEFFNANRAEGVDPIPGAVSAFLESVADYEPDIRFNVQPSFSTHYIAAAVDTDHHPWFYAKPAGVTFQCGDARNVEAVYGMWGDLQLEPPSRLMATDVWLDPQELTEPIAEFCLRLSAAWAEVRVGSRA